MKKTYSGFNKNTTENLLLSAGAVFVNFDLEAFYAEDDQQWEKVIGATAGGNTFTAVPEMRQIQPDGVKGRAKGLTLIQSWEVTLKTNLLEFTPENISRALAASSETKGETHTSIKGKNFLSDEDYLDNVTLITNVSGSNEPVIIQVFNVLNLEGLTIDFQDSSDIVTEVTFTGHYDADDLDNPPYLIDWPNRKEVDGGGEGEDGGEGK